MTFINNPSPVNINPQIAPVRTPELTDVLNEYLRQLSLNLNCHHVGTIQAFDAATQTVQVTINYQQTYNTYDPDSQTYNPSLQQYPLIAECPAIVLCGGSTYLNMPIAIGDECLLCFNDRDFDNWFFGSTTSGNQTPRLHSFSDGIALVGLKNLNNSITGYDTTRALITNGTVKNGINPNTNKLTLTNGTSLNTILQNLCSYLETLITKIQDITVGPGSFTNGGGAVTGISTEPLNSTDFTMISGHISDVATALGELIE